MKKNKNIVEFLKDKISFFSKHPLVIFLFLVFFGAFIAWQTFAAGTTYTWTNSGGDGLWTNSNNWLPVGTPGTGDLVVFNSSATADCTIDANVNLNTLIIYSGYTGTISRSGSYTFVVTNNFSQADGIFNAGATNMTFASPFTLSGGTFNASSATTYFHNFTQSAGTFNHNSGTVEFIYGNTTINVPTSITFYNFRINKSDTNGYLTISAGDNIIAEGLTNLKQGYLSYGDSYSMFSAKGNVTVDSTYNNSAGRISLPLKISGTEHQEVTIANGTFLPRLIFSGASTTVYGPISAVSYVYSVEIIDGNTEYIGRGAQLQFQSNSLQSNGNLTTTNTNWFFYGTYIHSSGTAMFGSGNLYFANNFTLSGGTFNAPKGTIYSYLNFTQSAGTFNHNSGTVEFISSNTTINVPTSITFYNFRINKSDYNSYLTIASGDNIIVEGLINLKQGYLNSGDASSVLTSKGNVTVDSTYYNNSAGRNSLQLKLNGTDHQIVTIAGHNSGIFLPRLILNGVSTTIYGPTVGTTYLNSLTVASGDNEFIDRGGQMNFGGTGVLDNSSQTGGNLVVANTSGAVSTWTIYGTTYTHSSGTAFFNSANVVFSAAFTQSGGTVSFGSRGATFNNFTQSAGTFNAGSGTIYFNYGFTQSTGAVFNSESGTVEFSGSGSPVTIDVPTSITFNNFRLSKAGSNYYLTVAGSDNIIVNGSARLIRGYLNYSSGAPALVLKGDLIIDNTYTDGSGRNNLQFKINGTGHQVVTLNSTAGGIFFPKLVLNGVSTTIYAPTLGIAYGTSLTTVSGDNEFIDRGGQMNFGSSGVNSSQTGGNLIVANTSGTVSTWTIAGSTYTQSSGTAFFDSANVIFSADFTQSGGTISFGSRGATFNNFTQSAGTFNAGSGTIYFSQNFTQSTGAVFNSESGTVEFGGGGSPVTIDVPTSITFNNFRFNKSANSYYLSVAANDNIIVNGSARLIRGYLNYSSGAPALVLKGDLTVDNTYTDGSGRNNLQFKINGTGHQIITLNSPSSQIYIPKLVLNGVSTTIYGPTIGTVQVTSLTTVSGDNEFIDRGGQMNFGAGAVSSSQTGGNLIVANTSGAVSTWTFGGSSYLHSGGTAVFDSASFVLTNADFTQSDGSITFGSRGANFGGFFTLSGGTFNAGSGTIYFKSHFTQSAGIFNAGSGTVEFTGSGNYEAILNVPTSITFNNFRINRDGTSYYLTIAASDTIIVNGTTNLKRGYLTLGNTASNVSAKGNVTIDSTYTASSGRNELQLKINGTEHQVVSIASGVYMPKLIFSGPSTTVYGSAAKAYLLSFQITDGNVEYIGQGGQLDIYRTSYQSGGTLTTVNTNWYFSGGGLAFSNGTANFGTGNVYFYGGELVLSGGTFNAPQGTTYFYQNFTQTGGTFNANNGTVEFTSGNNSTIDVPSAITFNNFRVNKGASSNIYLRSADVITVNGTATVLSGILAGYDATASVVDLKGNLTMTGGTINPNPSIIFSGSNDQYINLNTVTGNVNSPITINKTAGSVILSSNLIMDNAKNLTLTAGTLDLTDKSLTVNGTGAIFTIADEAKLRLMGSGTYTFASYPQFSNNSILEYYQTNTGTFNLLTVGSVGNLIINGVEGSIFRASVNTLVVNGYLNINEGGTLFANSKNIILASSTRFSNEGTLRLVGDENLNLVNDVDSGVVSYVGNGNSTDNVFKGLFSYYYNLEINFTDTGDALDINDMDLYDPLEAGLVAHWEMNEGSGTTVADSSGNNYNKTFTVGAEPTWATGVDGTSALNFDGSYDYLDIDLNLGYSDWTFSAWIKCSNSASTYPKIIDFVDAANGAFGVFLRRDTNYVELYHASGYISYFGYNTSDRFIDNTWHHIVVSSDRDTKDYLYLDGNLISSPTLNSGPVSMILERLGGRGTSGASNYYKGLIDDVRVYNRVLSSNEVKELAGMVLDTDLIAHWKMNEGGGTSILDSSGNGNTGTITGATWTTGKDGTSALVFDGNDYVNIGTDLYETRQSGTISAWVKQNNSGTYPIFSSTQTDGLTLFTFSLTNGKIYVQYYNNPINNGYITVNTIPANEWVFVSLTSDGSTWKIYVNGVEQSIETFVGSNTGEWFDGLSSFSNTLSRIGRQEWYNTNNYYFNGYIDDVRIYSRALTSNELNQLYNGENFEETNQSNRYIYGNFEGNSGHFVAPTTTLYINGNILVLSSNIFDPNSGLVVLNGGDQTITGDIIFNNLTKTTSSTETLYINASSTVTINGTATLTGAPNNLLGLQSTVSGTQATIDFAGARIVEFLDVKDIVNSDSEAVMCINGCSDSGNNINFTFITAPTHFEITKDGVSSASVTAGEDLNITVSLIGETGTVSSTFDGNYDLIFYGASDSPFSNHATVRDYFGTNRNFGSTTTLNFVDGIATTTVKLYKTETTQIDASGNNYNTSGSDDYALSVEVGSQILDNFLLSAPAVVTSGIAFVIDTTAKDAFGNITTYVNSNTQVSVTSTVDTFASINPTIVSSSEFADDGLAETYFTISNVTNLEALRIDYYNDYNGNITTNSVFLSAIGIPTAPSGVAASYFALNSFRITWSDTSGGVASGFVVERDTDTGSGFGNNWVAIATTTLATNSFIDNAVNNIIDPPQSNERYKYRVKSFNSVGYSVSYGSDPVAHYTVPGTPSNLLATYNSSPLKFDLTFTDNSAVSDYFSLDRCVGISCASNNFSSVSSSLFGTTTLDTSLSGNSRYRYRVKAIVPPDAPATELNNVSSTFVYSAYEYTAPATPSDLKFYQVSDTQWFLSWKDNSTYENGFEIQVSYDGGSNFEPVVVGATVGQNIKTYLFTSATTQNDLQFKIRAYIAATDNNAELYSGDGAGSQVLSTDFHYEIKGNSNQVAGNSQTISIILKDLNGNTSTFWTGDKTLIFSGASSSINGVSPTCSDKNGSPIVFGNTTTINFTNGVGSCNLILYRAGSTEVEVNDGFYSTVADANYSLNTTVTGNSLNRFLIDAPETINYSSSTMITVYALDAYYNNTLSVSGNTNLYLYVNSVLTGTVNPSIISATNFTDDGIWAGNIEITNIYENPTVVITAVNGSANGSDSFLFNGRPNTPGSVAVSYVNDNEFEITWQDRSTIETGYLVQKKTDIGSGLPGTWTTIATLSANTQSFVDNSTNNPLDAPQADRRYMYQIIATNNVVYSYGASDNLIHYTTPDYPTNFYATYVNDNRFNLYFTDNANVINTHAFSRCDSSECDSSTFTFLGKTSSSPYADTASLLANNRYKYVSHSETPSPENLISSDVYSAYEFTSPAAPSAFYASEATSNTISFVWTDNALYESGFLLEYSVASSSVFTPIYSNGITTVGADVVGFSFVSSTPDNAYRFKIRSVITATSRNGALYSSYVGGTEYVYSQPNAPINQAAIFSTSTVISLSWDDNSKYEDGFRIEMSVNGGEWSELTTSTNTVGANITTYDLMDVDLNNDYQFRVRAHIAGNTFAPEVFSEYTEVFSPQSYHFEFSPINDVSTIAGATTTVTLALKDSGGNIVSDYNGEKNVYFSGASSSITGIKPTVIDTNGDSIDFGSVTLVNFINGEAELNMFFSAAGDFNVDADTLAYSTSENNSYKLRVSVSPASVDSFEVSSDETTVTSTVPFNLRIVAFDEYLNTTTAVLGNTYINSSIGSISPVGISETDFNDDGIWDGSVTLSNTSDRNTVYLYINNGSANGELYLTAIGTPNKPSGVASSLNSDDDGSYFSISWSDNSVVETGYEIQRCVLATAGASCAEGDWSSATSTLANINNTRDYAVSLDSKIKYRVRGFNTIGYSDWATEVNYHFTKPDAPINVYAKRISSDQFSVYYSSQTGITSEHRIFRSDYYFTSNESNSFYSLSSPYSDTYQITANNRFLYNVKARTSDGIYSDDSYSIYEYTTPVAPSSVISAIVNETQVQISWVDNSLFESGFRIEESINSGSWNEIDSGNDQTGQNIRTYLHTVSSTSLNTYRYRVRAHVGETVNNSELFSNYSNEAIAEISDLHFEIYAPATTTAGVATALQIALRDVNGNNASYFTGDRILKFVSDGTQPTLYCSDKDGDDIMFGENTTVSFTNGTATCSTTLYNAVTTTIDVYDDSFSSTSSSAYDLDLKVEPNVARKFSVSAPTQAVSTVPSTVRLIAKDFWNNTTTLIFNTTTVSVSTGSVLPLQIIDSAFNDGIATISLVISGITERPAVNVEFRGFDSYSSTTIYGNAYITVLGVPNVPTSVSSVRNSNESITLSWSDNSTIESGYAIERQIDEGSGFGSWIFIDQVNTNVSSYTDYSTVANRRYKYRVRTIGSFANSDYAEDPINSLGGIYTTPAAPTFISPVRYSDNRFDITFIDNALVTNYFDLKRCDGAACGTNSFSAITTTPILLVPSQTVTGTINYTDNLNIDVNNRYRYAFTVKSPSSSGSTVAATSYSNYEYTKPAAPSGVNAIKTEENIIYIYWDDNSNYEDGFRIEYSDDSAENFTEVTPGTNTVGANIESYNFTIPSTTLTYLFRVKAHVPATVSNVELLSDYDQTQTSETHLVVTGSTTQNVGESQTITLTIRDGENNVITDYDGDKSIILTGPTASLTGVQATCTNKSGNPVNIGIITTINFVDGIGHCNFTPYRAENVLLRATDGLHTSYAHPSYNLNLTAAAGALNNFLVAIPATSSINLAFETIIYARDVYNNITKQVNNSTSLTSNVGSLNVNSISQSDFTDDGIWYGNLSISNLYDLNNVTVTAQNSGASGYDSIEIIAAPNSPLNVSAEYISDNHINIHWTDNSLAEDYYVVEKRSDATGDGFGSWITLATTTPNATVLSDINTTGNRRYEYRIYSGNIYGNSSYAYSNVVYTSLPAPVITTSTVLSANAINWDWTSSALFPTEFRLHFSSSNHLDYININSSSNSFTVSDLVPNTGYQIVLYAWRSDRGYSLDSNTSTLLYTFAALPTNIHVSTNTDETLTLTWDQNSNPTSTEYKVKNITTGDESEWVTENSWEDINLDCETSYNYILKARNHDNVETDWTATSTLETGLCVMPSVPNSFSAEYISDSQIDLSWSSTDIYSKSFIIEKRIDFGSGFNSWFVLATTTNANSSLSDTVVDVNSAYEYRIRSVNKIGESENLASSIIYTGLLAPTINTPSAILDNSITFNWINNSNFAEEFILEFVQGDHDDIENINATNTSFTVEDLMPNTIYSVKVYAFNSSRGRSEASTSSTAVYTLAEIPASITATSTTQNSMTLNWTAGNNPIGTEYYVENINSTSTNSGWTTTTSWNVSNLSCGLSYSFRVKTRNFDNVESAWSVNNNFSTEACANFGGNNSSFVYIKPSTDKLGIKINNNALYTNNKNVSLVLSAGNDIGDMAVSNDASFDNVPQESFSEIKDWILSDGDGVKNVYVRFFSRVGGISSETYFSSITLDTTPPSISFTDYKSSYSIYEKIKISGTTEAYGTIFITIDDSISKQLSVDYNGKWNLDLNFLPMGKYTLFVYAKDLAGNIGKENTLIINVDNDKIIVDETNDQEENVDILEDVTEEDLTDKTDSIWTKTKELGIEILGEISDLPLIKDLVDKISDWLKEPKTENVNIPLVDAVSKITPIAFEVRWNLLPVKKFILAPLPKEMRLLAEKFPEFSTTLAETGVIRMTDMIKLKTINFVLPGLSETVLNRVAEINIPIISSTGSVKYGNIKISNLVNSSSSLAVELDTSDINNEGFYLPSLPLAKLSEEEKKQIPTEVMFVKNVLSDLDLNTKVAINDDGRPVQKINTISGTSIELIVRPQSKVNSVKGYVVYRNSGNIQARSAVVDGLSLDKILSNIFTGEAVFADTLETAVPVEERLVLKEFDYTDLDGDGIYTAFVDIPLKNGEYEIITVFDYIDPELGRKQVRLITVVDPEGYVFEQVGDKELRIKGAVVSLYRKNESTENFELWNAMKYQQINPQTVGVTGDYSFLVIPGEYYLEVKAKGYKNYRGESFSVNINDGIFENIELFPLVNWKKYFDWKNISAIAFLLLILYYYNNKNKKIKK